MAGASASENGVDDDVEITVCVDDVRVVRAHESVSATMARPGNESRRCGACFLAVCIIWRGGFEYARTRTSGRQIRSECRTGWCEDEMWRLRLQAGWSYDENLSQSPA